MSRSATVWGDFPYPAFEQYHDGESGLCRGENLEAYPRLATSGDAWVWIQPAGGQSCLRILHGAMTDMADDMADQAYIIIRLAPESPVGGTTFSGYLDDLAIQVNDANTGQPIGSA